MKLKNKSANAIFTTAIVFFVLAVVAFLISCALNFQSISVDTSEGSEGGEAVAIVFVYIVVIPIVLLLDLFSAIVSIVFIPLSFSTLCRSEEKKHQVFGRISGIGYIVLLALVVARIVLLFLGVF